MRRSLTIASLASVAIFTVAVVAVTPLVLLWIARHSGVDWTAPSQLGGVFGATSALFSGLAFAGVVYTLAMQRHEMSEGRKDREASAKVEGDTVKALADQARMQRDAAMLTGLSLLVRNCDNAMDAMRQADRDSKFPSLGRNRYYFNLRKAEKDHYLKQIQAVIEGLGAGFAPPPPPPSEVASEPNAEQ